MNFTSPYNFVPLSTNVHIPEQQNLSQDFPLEEGYSGVIELEINNLNELILGDETSPGSESQPFFSVQAKQPAIPGTSIKGMIRSMLETATGGYIDMDENQFSQRDLTKATNDYMRALRAKKSGWLFWDNKAESWKIAPTAAPFKTVRHTSNVTHNEKNANTDVEHILEDLLPSVKPPIHRVESAVERYHAILGAKPKANKIGAAVEILSGQYLVVTNQLEDSTKRREFLFSEPTKIKSKLVSPDVFRKFEYVMDKSQTEMGAEHWGYLKSFANEGIPVFYLQDAQNEISAFGLPSLFRLPYDKALQDLLPNSHKKKALKADADFAGLLFGEIPTGDQTSMSRKGRVSFGLAKTNSVGSYQTHKLVLSNPKPTYYPAYLKQAPNDLKNYNTANQINGFKRYLPHKSLKKSQLPLNKDGTENQDEGVSKQVEVLTSKHTFKSKIRVHNVTAYELGALLWACTLGEKSEDNQYQQLLGMGKPLGYGKVKIKVASLEVTSNKIEDSLAKSQTEFLNEFYAYLAVNNLLNESFATLKASHRNAVVNDEDLKYLVLNPAKKQNDFLDMRKAKKSLAKLNNQPEMAMIDEIKANLAELIQAQEKRQEELALKLEAEREAARQEAARQEALEKEQEEKLSRSPFDALFEDEFNKVINKSALEKLIAEPSLYQSLSDEDRLQLINKIEVSDWFTGLKKKRSKWRKDLPDLLKK